MRITEVIESKHWVNTSDAEKPYWTIQVRGWTWRCKDGTIGLGRRPVDTRDEALQIMDQINGVSK